MGSKWADHETSERVGFSLRPRKGQFVVYKPRESRYLADGSGEREEGGGPVVPEHIIEPIATQFTKGVIAWRTVYGMHAHTITLAC